MVRKFIICGIALTFLTACADPADYKIGSKGGKDYYKFSVNSTSKSTYNGQLKFWGDRFCPQGFKLVESRYDGSTRSTIAPITQSWHEVVIACPKA